MREKIVANAMQNCTFPAERGLLNIFVILSSGSVWNGRENAFITHLHYYLCRVKLSWPKNNVLILLSGKRGQFGVGRGRNDKGLLFSSPPKDSLGRHLIFTRLDWPLIGQNRSRDLSTGL